jgi:hypothetical protein
VGEFTTNELADTPPNVTAYTSIKFVPVIVTVPPVVAEVGVKEVIVGKGYMNVKVESEASYPFGVVTCILPVIPVPATAVIVVGDNTVKEVADLLEKETP